jgi:hypothetical protein
MFKPSVDVGNIANIDIEDHIHEDTVKAAIESWICFDDIIDHIKFEPLEVAVNGSVWLGDPVADDIDVTVDVELSDRDLGELLVAHLDEMDRKMRNLTNQLIQARNDAYKGFDSNYHMSRWLTLASNSDSEVVFDGMMEMAKETMNV